ncbi:MAG: sulfurtransferase-like selenium metabolism protein YedF [Fusobacteriaceae bacterium]|jgi:selenium metabolism protein YedF|nr:sulfurtransferase-like selenium metabolism protein YedF [Fusobacteriaceae bacterium]
MQKKADDGNKGQALQNAETRQEKFKIPTSGNLEGLQKYPKKRKIVVVDGKVLGQGSEELGAILLKSFLYAVSRMDDLPDAVLLVNEGVKLACVGSDSLSDLKTMETQGVEILSCGTCLDYYGIKEKLAVGDTANMYTIVEKQMLADLIIRP